MQTSYIFTTLLAAAGLVAALPDKRGCTPGGVVDYVVKSGDNLTKIANDNQSGICDIALRNHLANPNSIFPGQLLKVPTKLCNPDNTSCLAPEGTATCVKNGKPTYTIQAGDNFYSIAQTLGLDLNALLNANKGVDPLTLQIGQVINVPVC